MLPPTLEDQSSNPIMSNVKEHLTTVRSIEKRPRISHRMKQFQNSKTVLPLSFAFILSFDALIGKKWFLPAAVSLFYDDAQILLKIIIKKERKRERERERERPVWCHCRLSRRKLQIRKNITSVEEWTVTKFSSAQSA